MEHRFTYRRKKPSPEEQAEERRQERETVRRMRGMAIGLSIPMFLAAGPLGGWLIGALLDQWLGTSWIMPVLIIASTIAGFKMAIDMLLLLNKS